MTAPFILEAPHGTLITVLRDLDFEPEFSGEVKEWMQESLRVPPKIHYAAVGMVIGADGWVTPMGRPKPYFVFENASDMILFKLRWG